MTERMDTCSVCQFFQRFGGPHLGQCRRRAPIATGFTPIPGKCQCDLTVVSAWPEVAPTDWCGDFQLRPPAR